MDTMIKEKKGLNARQVKFCLLRAKGMSQIDAYHGAGYRGPYSEASHLEKQDKVSQEIIRLQEKDEDKVFDLQAECRKSDPTSIATLQSIVNDPKIKPRAKIAAIKELLDRGHGRAKETIDSGTTIIWDIGRKKVGEDSPELSDTHSAEAKV